VDTDEKKKDYFMIGLSTKLQELMVLNTRGTFLEFISNVMIVDDAFHAHKETKKRMAVVTPSGSAPPKYRMMYHPDSHSNTNSHISSRSGLPTHLSASTSGRHLSLYLHLGL
jgi:hypothetical protein